ncbi:hypothetical protein NHX12_015476 [Muraenolepis orangiensis]|uniref:B30.2/SPRY domain-containing protein n=1 Tax=Muraenolepis orangiensis TaxID=630683 RepID=A0A9Q0D8S3_9TELE|nr:hypothetical protein NHX12_015476 [Muraenolepis orangiensis]
MSGRRGGVQRLLQDELGREIPYVHRFNHQLHLVVVHAMSGERAIEDLFNICNVLYTFTRKPIVAAHYQGNTLKRLLEQRWTGHLATVHIILKSFQDIVELLRHLKRVQQYGVEVTLDPDTAHPQLILSDDGKQVHDGGVVKKLPDNPKRFTWYINVLTRQSFSSGRFYFEVQVKDKTEWRLGVTRESVNRKDDITRTTENGFWTLKFFKDKLVFNDNPAVRLPVRAEIQKVGVFVDYDAGLVSFYDVEARAHIYSATGCTFSEPPSPFLNPGLHDGGRNSTPLIISPVNQTGLC